MPRALWSQVKILHYHHVLKDLQARVKDAWLLVVIAGIASMLFGLIAIFMPGVTAVTLAALFAVLLIMEGVMEIAYAVGAWKEDRGWWLSLVFGALLLGFGIYLVANPALTPIAFAVTVGWILVIRGVVDGALGASGQRTGLLLGAILALIAGIIMLISPEKGLLAFAWALGIYAFVNGIIMVSTAFSARTRFRRLTRGMAAM